MATTSKRWTRAQARVLVDELEASGLSVPAFCRRRALPAERLQKWRARFRREAAGEAPRLVELVLQSAEPGARPLESIGKLAVRCPSGHAIEMQDVELAHGLRLILTILDEIRPC